MSQNMYSSALRIDRNPIFSKCRSCLHHGGYLYTKKLCHSGLRHSRIQQRVEVSHLVLCPRQVDGLVEQFNSFIQTASVKIQIDIHMYLKQYYASKRKRTSTNHPRPTIRI